MKDSQERWQSNSRDSVIATLMGFDEQHSMRSFHENHKVLSESYIRKVSSIAKRSGSLVSTRRSCSSSNEIIRSSNGKNENFLGKWNSSTSYVRTSIRSSELAGASVSKSFSGDRYEDRKSSGKKGEHYAARRILRYQQKLEYDSHAGHFDELGIYLPSNSPLETVYKSCLFSTSITGFKPMSEMVAFDHKDVKFDIHSRPGYRDRRKSLMPASGEVNLDFAYKQLTVNGYLSSRHSCIACTRTMNRIPQQERCRSKFEDLLAPGYKNYSHDPRLLIDKSSLTNISRKQKLEMRKIAKEVQESGTSRRNQNLNEKFVLADKKSMARNLDVRLDRKGSSSPSSVQSRTSGFSSRSNFTSSGVWDDDCQKSSADFEFEEIKKDPSNGWNLKQDESTSRDNKSNVQTTLQEDILESKSGNSSVQFPSSQDVDNSMSTCSKVSELSNCNLTCFASSCTKPEAYSEVVRASFNEFSDEESAYSNCSGIGPPESPEILKRTSQHSPSSVLESYDSKNPPHFECFDSIGLRLQLQALNFESEENCSEGSIMIVSGDEDFEEKFATLSHDGRKVKSWLGEDESKDFSYMVDVLDEAGFCDTNSFMDFNKWASLECPISLAVFDVLEKKYGKQTSWPKLERQLLFDRINSGLLEIFDPVKHFHAGATSIRRKFCASFRRDKVEDELWTILVSQETEKSKDLSGKALDKWSELEEGISIICGELETCLFDELVMELANLWN